MSVPENKLASFRSYSYHHVLAVCDSTNTALELSNSSVFNDIFLSDAPTDTLEVFTTKQLAGRYIILIDGFVDARFVIQSAKWATVLAPDDDITGMSTTVETDGEMEILEPRGARFLNVLSSVCRELSSDPIGLVFVLKTFFVGHNHDGTTELISNIRPLFFIAIDIQAKFDETGSEYTLSFVGVCNGASRMPYINEIASQVTITNNVNGEQVKYLSDIFDSGTDPGQGQVGDADYRAPSDDYKKGALSTIVNQLYEKEKSDLEIVLAQIRRETGTGRPDGSYAFQYRPVEYRFNLDPEYVGEKYIFGSNEQMHNANDLNDPILSFPNNTTFEHIINQVMLSCAEVVKEAEDPEVKYTHKITSAINSTSTTYVVDYYVNRYKTTTPTIDKAIASGKRFEPDPGTVIEFDYMFTGLNTDIIEFDIKMEMGLAFFHLLSTTANRPRQAESQENITPNLGKGMSGSTNNTKLNDERTSSNRRLTPLFLGGQTRDSLMRNKRFPVSTLNYKSMLARHAALENVHTTMLIHGNPQLLDETTILPTDLARRQTEDKKDEETISPTWMKLPSYVKLNIRMPSLEETGDYTESFWYDGYFQMLFINNMFNDGKFTQELEMFSLPFGDAFDVVSDPRRPQWAIGRSPADIAANDPDEEAKFYIERQRLLNEDNGVVEPPPTDYELLLQRQDELNARDRAAAAASAEAERDITKMTSGEALDRINGRRNRRRR